MHHQLLEAGLKNDACIREWIKREKKRGEREKSRGERKRGDVRRYNKDKAMQMSGCGHRNVSECLLNS